jgi:hypothetical protein
MSGPQPQNQMERDFERMFREARRKLFSGAGAKIPLHMRGEIMKGVELTHTETGEVVCTLADDDYLERFRAACKRATP